MNKIFIGAGAALAFGLTLAYASTGATVVSWESVRSHAVVGEQSLALSPLATATETRQGGLQKVVINFDLPVQKRPVYTHARSLSTGILHRPTSTFLSDDGKRLELEYANLPDGACYKIDVNKRFDGLAETGDKAVYVKVLAGDVTGDGLVSGADVLKLKNVIGTTTDLAIYDVNRTGEVNLGDALFARFNMGHSASCSEKPVTTR